MSRLDESELKRIEDEYNEACRKHQLALDKFFRELNYRKFVCDIPESKADALIEKLKKEICKKCEEDGRCGEKDRPNTCWVMHDINLAYKALREEKQ